MRQVHAILVDAQVVPVDVVTWAEHNSKGNWRIAYTEVGEVQVSTIFLGINHELSEPPLWFETACFGDKGAFEPLYCTTVDEALSQHERMVGAVRAR